MGIMYRAVRGAAHKSKPHAHPQPKPKPAPRAQQTTGTDAHHAADLARLNELAKWAGAIPERVVQTAAPAEVPAPLDQATTADRPRTISDMVGQQELRDQLAIVCAGTRVRGKQMPHVLISGPAGFGKTSLSGIIAGELGWNLIVSNGMTLRKVDDLVGILIKASPNTVLFIDEIHALPKPVQEALYEVLEDGKISTTMGHGAEATAYTHTMQGFVCVGATTRLGLLTIPMRDRFGVSLTMADYSTDELAEIVRRAWTRQGATFTEDEPVTVAQRGKGVPRRSLHLGDRVLDYCAAHGMDGVEPGAAAEALDFFHVDEWGLDDIDFKILTALTTAYAGKTVGLDALATFLDVDAKTLENDHEPYLIRSGLVGRQKSGRMALPLAYDLLRDAAEETTPTLGGNPQ